MQDARLRVLGTVRSHASAGDAAFRDILMKLTRKCSFGGRYGGLVDGMIGSLG